MFLKVFKYDFKSVFFKFLPVLAILPILAILVRIVNLFPMNNIFSDLMVVFFNSFFIFGCSALFIYTIVICIMRFVKSLFRDQGYLTHTLPVNKHQLLLSQILVDVLMELISVILVSVCLMIAYFGIDTFVILADFVSNVVGFIVTDEELIPMFAGTLVLLFFSLIFGSLQSLLVIYTGVAIGHAFSKNKGILSVVFCIAINYGIGFVIGIINIVVGIIMDFASVTAEQAIGAFNIYLGINLAECIAICVAGYFLDIYLMKHKLNLE